MQEINWAENLGETHWLSNGDDFCLYMSKLFLSFINDSSSDKPIACPHLGHMDAPWYRGKEQRVWISKHWSLDIQTRVFGNQLEKAIYILKKFLLLLLFAVYIYVYSAIQKRSWIQ